MGTIHRTVWWIREREREKERERERESTVLRAFGSSAGIVYSLDGDRLQNYSARTIYREGRPSYSNAQRGVAIRCSPCEMSKFCANRLKRFNAFYAQPFFKADDNHNNHGAS